MTVRWLMMGAALMVAGCASKPPEAPVVAAAPAPVAPPPPSLPPGATPGMLVPTALADGSFPTPNQHVSDAAALWHLRAGLNVAALSCPGEQGAAITAGYNALLAAHKAELKTAEATYAAEFRDSGGSDWRDRYDNAMTRLYNFFSQTPVRPGFCAAATQILTQAAAVPPTELGTWAGAQLPALDQPFMDFYRAYDAWRRATARPVIAVMAAAPGTPPGTSRASATSQRPAPPRLELDVRTLPSDPLAGS